MPLQGIIFDFNGVLWWDGHLQERAWGQFSKEKRDLPFSREEMALHVHGRNNQHTLGYLMGRALTGEELRQLTHQKETIYRQLCLDQGRDFRLSPGAVELLDFLVANDIPHTIATASGRMNLEFFAQHLDLPAATVPVWRGLPCGKHQRIFHGQPRFAVWSFRQLVVYWDGTDNFGNKVKPGMYFYRISTGNRIIGGKIVKVE